jgi:hypothetical protein
VHPWWRPVQPGAREPAVLREYLLLQHHVRRGVEVASPRRLRGSRAGRTPTGPIRDRFRTLPGTGRTPTRHEPRATTAHADEHDRHGPRRSASLSSAPAVALSRTGRANALSRSASHSPRRHGATRCMSGGWSGRAKGR